MNIVEPETKQKGAAALPVIKPSNSARGTPDAMKSKSLAKFATLLQETPAELDPDHLESVGIFRAPKLANPATITAQRRKSSMTMYQVPSALNISQPVRESMKGEAGLHGGLTGL